MRALYTSGGELAAALSPADDRLDVFHAAAFGRLDRLRALLGADDELRAALSGDGFTALHLACFAGGEDATRVLVNHGAPLETVSRHAQVQVRPLGTAAFSRDHASARVLLDAGADPNGAGSEGFRPLHTAAQNGDLELVRLLLAHGADPSAATDDGRTPQQIAREAGHADAAGLLAGDRAVAQG
jgi:ankyrin repeat protein